MEAGACNAPQRGCAPTGWGLGHQVEPDQAAPRWIPPANARIAGMREGARATRPNGDAPQRVGDLATRSSWTRRPQGGFRPRMRGLRE